jgi:hypothetical protein
MFILLQFVTPPYASRGYQWNQWGDVIMYSLRNAFIYSYAALYPVFKIVPIILIAFIIVFRNRFSRWFSMYAAFSYILFAFGQNIAVTQKYGLSICTINLIMFLAVAAFWIWEVIVLQNDFSPKKVPFQRYWIVPLALLAFWYPLNKQTCMPDFNPAYLFTNGAGIAFCTMTPVYIGLLTIYYPRVNIATLRVTSLVGLIIGIYNMIENFCINPAILWWNGVLHIPLLIISLYGLLLSFTKRSSITQIKEMENNEKNNKSITTDVCVDIGGYCNGGNLCGAGRCKIRDYHS